MATPIYWPGSSGAELKQRIREHARRLREDRVGVKADYLYMEYSRTGVASDVASFDLLASREGIGDSANAKVLYDEWAALHGLLNNLDAQMDKVCALLNV